MQVDRAWMKEQLSRIKYQSRMKIHLYPFDTDSEQNYRSIYILCHHKLHNPLFFLLLYSIKYIYSAVSFGSKNPQWTDKQSDISFPIMTSYIVTRGRLAYTYISLYDSLPYKLFSFLSFPLYSSQYTLELLHSFIV